jgi:hypothetical protein
METQISIPDTWDLDKLAKFLEKLHRENPMRDFKIMIYEDRGNEIDEEDHGQTV